MSYRDEEVAQLHKKVADLQDALAVALDIKPEQRAPKKEWKMPKIEDAFAWGAFVALAAVASIGLWALAHVAFTHNKIDYCYTVCGENSVYLKAHREWDADITLSKHASFHDAALAAEEMHCPLSGGVGRPAGVKWPNAMPSESTR